MAIAESTVAPIRAPEFRVPSWLPDPIKRCLIRRKLSTETDPEAIERLLDLYLATGGIWEDMHDFMGWPPEGCD